MPAKLPARRYHPEAKQNEQARDHHDEDVRIVEDRQTEEDKEKPCDHVVALPEKRLNQVESLQTASCYGEVRIAKRLWKSTQLRT